MLQRLDRHSWRLLSWLSVPVLCVVSCCILCFDFHALVSFKFLLYVRFSVFSSSSWHVCLPLSVGVVTSILSPLWLPLVISPAPRPLITVLYLSLCSPFTSCLFNASACVMSVFFIPLFCCTLFSCFGRYFGFWSFWFCLWFNETHFLLLRILPPVSLRLDPHLSFSPLNPALTSPEGLAFEDRKGRVLQRMQTLNWDTAVVSLPCLQVESAGHQLQPAEMTDGSFFLDEATTWKILNLTAE